ncbi:MAG: hypothetical protein PF503_06530 [Desulfobacula sp.]|jgi:hypothetical protein|nr:hypothetical protein [Desulfobacula sp.]
MDTRYYQTGGFTIEVNSELPINADTFHPKFKQFEVNGPGPENIVINHYFNRKLPIDFTEKDRIYFKAPWAVYQKQDRFIYEWLENHSLHTTNYRKFLTNKDHTRLDTYNNSYAADFFLEGKLTSLSLFPTDQILLSRILAFRQGCIMHSMGLIHKNKGYLFIGHSGAGKSTMAKIMEKKSVILCDDRNIIRKTQTEYSLFGTWKPGDISQISPLSATLRAIFFLNQSDKNQLDCIPDNKIKFRRLLSCLVKPLATDDWWESTIDFMDKLSRQVDCLDLQFDKSGKIRDIIEKL